MILIKNGLVYRNKQFKKLDILIENNKIIKMEPDIEIKNGFELIDVKDNIVSPGFIDMHVHLREPGFTHKETIISGTKAAARGGYTTVAAMPNTNPVIDCIEIVEDIKKRLKKDALVNVLLYSSITKGEMGTELVDFSGMAKSGVIAFSDDGRGVQSEMIMKEAMKRSKYLNKVIVAHCEDDSLISKGGVIHEGAVSHHLGVTGIPSSSEYEQVNRDIRLVEETGCQYHICHISTKESVDSVRLAKANGINVTCEVTPHHLLLCDEDVDMGNANFKMNPPLRSREDQLNLIEGLKDGTIDIIATDHAPHSEEEKLRSFKVAPFGVVGLETSFPLLYTHLVIKKLITLEQLLDCMTCKPAQLFGLEIGTLEIGADADITIIDLNKTMLINSIEFESIGKNTPFEGIVCQGVIEMTFVQGKMVYKYRSD